MIFPAPTTSKKTAAIKQPFEKFCREDVWGFIPTR